MVDVVLGYMGALLASVFFGSNYVPVKNYPTGDGMSFVWVFASGILVIGFLSVFVIGEIFFVYSGLLGGSLWATGNLCVIPVVKMIGLGLGLLVWGATSLITGFLSGKFGWFGIDKRPVSHPIMNWFGIASIIVAMGVSFLIKPELNKKKEKEYAPLMAEKSIQHIVDEEVSIFDQVPKIYRFPLGIGLSLLSGVLYGVNLVPMSLWFQHPENKDKPVLAFVFSHFTGIYLYSSTIFIIYCIYKGVNSQTPKIYPQSILPSMISGAMWGLAQCGLMVATNMLGWTVGFPIGSAGPIIVSSLWSVLYFKEISGQRNIILLLGVFAFLGTGIALLASSS